MTAVILAGGRGSRMKADKATLAIGSKTLLEHVAAQLVPHVAEILVSVSPGQRIAAAKEGRGPSGRRPAAGDRGMRIVEDELPGHGPLGGILTGLKAAANDACAVVACDIPDVDVALLRSLAEAAGRAEIAVPLDPEGRYEPLFAVYRRSVISEIEALLRSGERSILPLYQRRPTAVLRIGRDRRLRNLNTRANYLHYLKSRRIT